jgi:hypothetical protein
MIEQAKHRADQQRNPEVSDSSRWILPKTLLPVLKPSTVLPSTARLSLSPLPSEDEQGHLLQVNTMGSSLMIDLLTVVVEVVTVEVVDTEVVEVTVRQLRIPSCG